MDLFGVLNVCCAVAGACLFIYAILLVNRIISLFPRAKMTGRWKVLKTLIYFFLAGYVVNILALISEQLTVLLVFQALVYLLGALFVVLVISVSLRTYSILIEASEEEKSVRVGDEKIV